MDDATLDRLMIDDALGALEPDISVLLAAYTATIPDIEQRRAGWRDLAEKARHAMAMPAADALPPFPAAQLRAARFWHNGRLGVAIAAVLALGVGIGLWMPGKHVAVAPIAQVINPAPSSPPRAIGVSDFWSSRRLLASAVEHGVQGRPAWRWSSPLTESANGELQ
jgi:hypothetical protein